MKKQVTRVVKYFLVFILICAIPFFGLLAYSFFARSGLLNDWGRTPSKERFEKNCHIKLPPNYKVLRDEYQDMMQDYAIYYTLKMDSVNLNALIKSIRKSNGFWQTSTTGYKFHRQVGGTDYYVDVDTVNRIASFEEIAD
ncbi:hypothetical protein GCM10027049_20620 [Mucilaginibacter puniceus]